MGELKSFRGKPYVINSQIVIRQPTLDEICEYGEQEYFDLVRSLCATPADRKVEIWEALHTYWEKIDEFDLFVSTFGRMQNKDMSILFPDINFTSFKISAGPVADEAVLKNQGGVVIDRAIHALITNYLRSLHRLTKNMEAGYNDATRDIMIEDEKEELERVAKKPYRSFLRSLISAMTNCPEFKYRFDDVWSLPIGAFMDAVERVQKHKHVAYLMQGIYSGTVDAKKINNKKDELNWIGELK